MASKNMSLGKKLLLLFLAVGLLPLAVIAVIALMKTSGSLEEAAYNNLTMAREIKKTQIENFFKERQGDMGVLVETVGALRSEAFQKLSAVQQLKKSRIESFFSERRGDALVLADNPNTIKAFKDLEKAFKGGGGATGGRFKGLLNGNFEAPDLYRTVHGAYYQTFKTYMEEYGYYDVFLMDAENGDVCFTVVKENDFAQRTDDVPSSLRDAWHIAVTQKRVNITDTRPYAPSAGAPAQFVAAPMIDNGKVIGCVAMQISLDAINSIMLERDGMGETGESYLVGQDGIMRSDSYLDPVGHSVVAAFGSHTVASTEAIESALAGNADEKVIIDYNGNPVLSCWDAVEIDDGVRWAMMSEVDVAEAFCPKDDAGTYYYETYVNAYGYYDLFLINPDGYCFYTVAKESDYQTNLINGKYASSGLGVLARNVIQSQQFGIVDFAPYAPSNNEPASFIAQPIIHDGKVEMIVALQLSLEAINSIMQQREGMGETGETYLVGSDKRMRSDSYLDPTGHSVHASFAGNIDANGCDTEASREALAGRSDTKVIIDYNGNPVLSSFTPVKVGDFAWALMAEIDESEAMATVNALQYLIAIIAVIASATVILIALWTTRSITKPITGIINNLSSGSEQVSSASEQLASASQSLAEGSSEQASSLEETSSSLEEMASMTRQNADNAKQANNLMADSRDSVTKGNQSMENLNLAIDAIKTSSDETAKIIKVIDEIAFQTNLLALNAAVEAARAGEAGKGFAVVAEEVRNLAQRSAEAAKNTSSLIEGAKVNAEKGVAAAAEMTLMIKDIAESSVKVAGLVGEITEASSEQAQGIDQINTAVSQIDQVTQQNASNAEESSSASQEMAAQAQQMQEIVGNLSELIFGNLTMNAAWDRESKVRNKTSKNVGSRLISALPKLASKKGAQLKAAEPTPEELIPFDEKELVEF